MKRTEISDKPDLEFEYDAMGNRIAKHVIHSEHTLSTFYVRDAEGTIMATYTKTNETELALEEQPIYGSSRLGVYHPTAETGIMRGARTYEASNHLGNVLATYTDRVILNDDFEYVVDQTSATDYFVFGSKMYGRDTSFSSSEYKFGFNGQEKEDDIYGEGNAYSAEYWMYDSRLGRRWNVDPVDQISISNYAVFYNSPLFIIDPYGDTGFQLNSETGELTELEATEDRNDGGDEYDVLYSSNDDGSLNVENNIQVSTGILNNFNTESYYSFKNSSVEVSGDSWEDAFSIFVFASDNSNVEWGYIRYEKNEQKEQSIILSTTHQPRLVLNASYYNISQSKIISQWHSHPNISMDEKSELETMGIVSNSYYKESDYGRLRESTNNRDYSYSVYFPESRNYYRLTPFEARNNQMYIKGTFPNTFLK